ncbi:P-loop NTPase [Natranaerofaba carboxydovora]|uniref:P-loop NTPase n=1 Tax=Natranaerofaba carboxydovora TaxID=2742683 RepID=UPI001F13D80D|nr:P-loop NTPase [Natranaerofaba carboxydovora]UMZ73381.1 Flagellum site-determining protein YlxH [Natranaerofaba carboxydovora]
MFDQAETLRKLVKEKKNFDANTKTIGVFSGKGGVGKSSFAINLAFALKDLNKKVMLVDCDIGLYNLSLLMGIEHEKTGQFTKMLLGESNWEENLQDTAYDIDLLGGGIEKEQNISDPKFDFISEIKAKNAYQYIVIDTGPGINQSILNLFEFTDINTIITTPELTSITDSYAMMKSLVTEKKTNLFHLVVNRSTSSEEADATYFKLDNVIKKFLNAHLEFLGYIPEDRIMKSSIKHQYPAFLSKPYAPSIIGIRSIARKLISLDLTTERSV